MPEPHTEGTPPASPWHPLSSVQREIWFDQALFPNSAVYNVSACHRVEGEIDLALIRRVLEELVQETDVLRVALAVKGGEPLQSFPDMPEVSLRYCDLSGATDPEKAAKDDMRRAANAPFRVLEEPLFRFTLYRLSERRHLWLQTFHHLVVDGRAIAFITRRCGDIYSALARGEPIPARSGVPYPEFIASDAAYLASDSYERHQQHWKAKFSTLPEPLFFPKPEHARRSDVVSSGILSSLLPRSTYAQLEAMAQAHSVTVFHAFVGLLYVLFTRTRDRDECVIGLPVLNRNTHAFKQSIGLYASVVPARFSHGRELSFVGLMQAIAGTLRESYRSQRFPLSEINRLAGAFQAGRRRLFDLSLSFIKHDYTARFGEGARSEVSYVNHNAEQLPLTLYVGDYSEAQDIELNFTYNLAYFDAEEMGRIQAQFMRLLEQVLANPERSIRELDLLTDEERRRLLDEWNPRAAPRQAQCVHRAFEARAAQSPEAAAVISDSGSLTYGELHARANRLARVLIALGVSPDDRVAIALQRSPEMIVALLATLKAGGAYVPLDPDAPAERLDWMLEDAGAKALLTRESLRPRFSRFAKDILCLEGLDLDCQPADAPRSSVEPRHLAYVIYTSGSTGRPRGVAVEHQAIAAHCKAVQALYGLDPRDRVFQFAAFSFDASAEQILSALSAGAALVLPPHGPYSAEELNACVQRHGVTVLDLPPAFFRPWTECCGERMGPSLRLIILGGDVLPPEALSSRARWNRPGLRILNAYGPTEATVTATVYEIPEAFSGSSVPIGRPLPGRKLYVLDAFGQPAPIRVAGELYIGGEGLARGYLNQPELTAERFIADVFGNASGARLYRTGDKVRYLPDGNLEFLGRADHQVKVRGFRVEPGEVEAALVAHPALREAVVVAGDEAGGEQRLVAYLVAKPDAATRRPDVGELRTFLKTKLPEYMVPAAYVWLPALPLTSGGKVDRKALPEPEITARTEAPTVPRDALEEIVAGLWANELSRASVGIHADFFELGGHSLLATRLASRLCDALCLDVPIRWIFEAPTVAELAELIRKARATEGESPASEEASVRTIQLAPRDQPLPLSLAQQSLWFIEQLEGRSPTYNMPGVLELTGVLDVGALRSALSEIVRRHESLRTYLVPAQGGPVQVIAPARPLDLPVTDLRGEADPDIEAKRLAREEARKVFDLAREVPLRLRLLRRHDVAWTLLMTLHHSAADGWSIAILLRELSSLYRAYVEGNPLPWSEPARQYADFALWQRGYLTGERLERQLKVWRNRLAGAPQCIALPVDRPRPPRQSHGGALVSFRIDAELASRLRELSRKSGSTLFMTLLSAWASLLGRYSGESDIIVGSPVANRTQSAIEPLIGFFVNTLALRADLSGNPSFLTVLGRLRQVCLEAYAYQEIPFESLVEALGVPRTLSHAPLFQVMFALQDAEDDALVLSGLDASLVEGESAVAKFDLTMMVTESRVPAVGSRSSVAGGRTARVGTLGVTLEYATDLFDRPTIDRMGGHFVQLLRSAVAQPERSIGEMDILTPDERRTLLADWNVTTESLPDSCIHHRFESQARRFPDATALVCGNETLSYGELNARANQLAHALVRRGVGPDTLVAIVLEHSSAMVIAMLATLKAGGAYVPLDPEYPTERLALMLEDSGARVLITRTDLQALLPRVPDQVIRLDADLADIARRPSETLRQPVAPNKAAYVIYTSGSTGKPKGVVVEHRNVVQLLFNGRPQFDFSDKDVWIVSHSFCFDFSVWEMCGALLLGGRLVIPSRDEVRDITRYVTIVSEQRVTVLNQTPAAFYAFAAEALQRDHDWSAHLHTVIFGGDRLEPWYLRRWAERFPSVALVNMYGITETTVHVTLHRLTSEDLTAAGRSPIGRPLPETSVFVCDAFLNPQPVGVPGEMLVGGSGVARGYLNHPELTAERFIDNPFQPGGRLYRSGDLARYLPDGNLEYLGRIDNQVKIRGFRVELGEIEAALNAHPAVRETVVLTRKDAKGDTRLAAYLVAEPGATIPETGELRTRLKAKLPDYMIPAAFVWLDAFPLTSNGKVDRKALPEPEVPVASQAPAAARDALEEILVGLWASALNLPAVGIHENFFELGGHSLLATKLASRLRDALGFDVPVRWIFEAPTVAELAERIRRTEAAEGEGAANEAASVRAIPLAPRDQPVPLSFAQQRLWFIDQLEGHNSAYIMPGVLELDGVLDVGVLQSALSEIVRRHESLRTCLVSGPRGPVQIIAPAGSLALEIEDLRGESDPDALAKRMAREEALKPFDLAREMPLRVRLLCRQESAWTLLLTLHHSAADGWSVAVFLRELSALYGAYLEGKPSPLPEPSLQYADFSLWQRGYLTAERRERGLDVLRKRMADVPECLNLPTDRPRPPHQSYRGASVSFNIDTELAAGLRELGRNSGSTQFMTLLAVWAELLGRYSGESDIVIGSPVANRTQSAIEPLIGFFVNTLVLRADLSGNPSFLALLGRLRQVCLEAYAHQEIPFELLVEALGVPRNLSHAPLFQVMFALQDTAGEAMALPGMEASLVEEEGGVAKFDLTLTVTERRLSAVGYRSSAAGDQRAEFGGESSDEGLAVTLEYATDLFDRSTIERMGAHFLQLLRAAVADPQQAIGELAILTSEEKRRILFDWSTTTTHQAPQAASVLELFDAQVRRAPDATALVFEDEALTYAELDTRANQLAHALMKRGVGPDWRVAIALERSPTMIVALLATLKAGGAYVPLDRSFPEERLAHMLADSGARVLLTQTGLNDKTPRNAEHVIALDTDWGEIAALSEASPCCSVAPDQLAYVIYTSGSTGKPKGVAIEHGPLAHHCRVVPAFFGLTPRDRVLQFASLSFDASVEQILPTLCTGATLVLPEHGLNTPEGLDRILRRHQVTVAHLPPAFFEQWVLETAFSLADSWLRLLQVGGDVLPGRLVSLWQAEVRRRGRTIRLLNGYGPTEATVTTTYYDIPESFVGASVPIGRPLSRRTVYVLDPLGQPVPVGVPGELHIGGVGLARGYLNRPELTAEKFIADPFSGQVGARLYKTGDLARFRSDGNIELLGRLDHQVKIRGFRVELGEIEAALAAHPAVREVVGVARKFEGGDQRLVAYLVSANEAAARPDSSELRSFLKATLPEHMLPAAYVWLPALPLTPNGKMDRKALPEPGLSAPAPTFVAPRDWLEESIARIWGRLLHQASPGINDNFFELGGHSLLAVQLASRLREALGATVPVRWIFEAPTIAELAGRLRQSASGSKETIQRVEAAEDYAVSHAQRRLWVLDRMDGGGAAYVMAGRFALTGPIDGASLERAFQALVDRHESLRTVFLERMGEPRQRVLPHLDFRLERQGEEDIAARSFELAAGPLLRAGLGDGCLIVAMHHIASDGWSLRVLTEELGCLYRGEALKPLPLHYKDYAAWQNRLLSEGWLAEDKAYWLERLTGAPPLDLPTDYPRLPIKRYRGRRLGFHLAAERVAGLRRLSQRHDATLFVGLLSLIKVLLARYSGQEDILVGTPVSGRTRRDLEGLVGCLINMLVLRDEVDFRADIGALLRSQRKTVVEALEHEAYPFDLLVDDLNLPRDLGRSPLFDVVLVLNEADSPSDLRFGDTRATPLPFDLGVSKFDLTFDFLERGDALDAEIEFDRDLFGEARIRRLWGHFELLLDSVLADERRPLGSIGLLTAEELRRHQAYNGGDASYPREASVASLFVRTASLLPEAVAVISGDKRLSYAELARLAGRVSAWLAERGLMPGERVAIRMDPSERLIAAVLGVALAGGTYVPVDPVYPEERQRFILEDAACRLAVEECTFDQLPAEPAASVAAIDVGQALYVIYTSGSTGRPKGCVVSHRNVVRLLVNDASSFDFGADDVWVMAHSSCFDFSVWEMYGALLWGGHLVVPKREQVRDPEQFLDVLEKHGVTILNQTPAAFYNLSRVALDRRAPLDRLRMVIFGGDRLEPRQLIRWVEAHPLDRVALVNMYGITETTVHVTQHRLGAADLTSDAQSVIGRPIPTTRVYVCDSSMNLLPEGVQGEMYIGGDGVALGYLNRPELTAERFVESPFRPGERLYRSGDVALWRDDGVLVFLGRNDHQVQVRGYRVEPAEIETRLLELPAISKVVVLPREEDGVVSLVAYLVVEEGSGAFSVPELRRWLAVLLPDYMVPGRFCQLERMPITGNGKIDRAALLKLPQAGDNSLGAGSGYVAPRNLLERSLVEAWQAALGHDQVGVHDNYFNLGGDSLKVLRLTGLIRQTLGRRVPVRDFFRHPTIAELAAHLERTNGADESPTAPSQAPWDTASVRAALSEGIEDAYPLSTLQTGMVFHTELSRTSSAIYHDIFSFRLRLPIDPTLLRRAVEEVVACHPVLRTSFDLTSASLPLQHVHRDVEIPLGIEDLSSLSPEAQAVAVESWQTAERTSDFNWSRPPLFRIQVHLRGPEEMQFSFSFHHAILDGWSVAILLSELFQRYLSLLDGKPMPLRAPIARFRDFISDERRVRELDEARQFWDKTLAGLVRTTVPRMTGAKGPRDLVAAEPVGIPEAVCEGLRALARSEGVPFKSVLFAAHCWAVSRFCNETDIVTGMVQNGRLPGPDGDKVLGLFLNTIPLRVRFEGGSWKDLVGQVFRLEEESLPYRQFPLIEIQRLVGERDLLEIAFNYTHFHAYHDLLKVGRIEVLDGQFHEQTNFVLGVVFTQDPETGHVALSLQYKASELTAAQMGLIGRSYARALAAMAANPNSSYEAASPLDEGELKRVLTDWSTTRGDYPRDASIARLFELQAAATPDAAALVHEGYRISYDLLNRRANRVAHLLRGRGLRPDSLVAVVDDRSPDTLAALLGILKAGGAYMPVDPAYPKDRVRGLLSVAKPEWVLTRESVVDKLSFLALKSLGQLRDRLKATPLRPPITDLDSLPYPDRSLIDQRRYDQYIGEGCVKGNITMFATRGCPYRCLYCHNLWPKKHNLRSAENVFEEVRRCHENGYDTFSFIDDIFNLNRENASRFFELVLKHGLKLRILFPNGLKGDLLTPQLIDLMAEAGVIQMALALETASARLQSLIGKRLNIEKLRENLAYISARHPQIVLDLFTMFGFPTETEAEALSTLDFIKSVRWLHFPTLNALKIFPNTAMAEMAMANGVSEEAISRATDLAYHELAGTMPFPAAFSREFQASYFRDYFLLPERLRTVIPQQKKVLTTVELEAKYRTYVPGDLEDYPQIMELIHGGEPARSERPLPQIVHLRPALKPGRPLKVLLLDLSQLFSSSSYQLNELVEAPLGLLCLLTYLNRELGDRIEGRIAKSMIDFDSWDELHELLEEAQPHLVGIRTLSLYRDFFHQAVSLISEWAPQAAIISGGPYATAEYTTLLSDLNVDLVVRGEGERTLAELCRGMLEADLRLPDDEVLADMPGIAFLPKAERRRAPVGAGAREVLLLDRLEDVLAAQLDRNPEPVCGPSNLAYVMFTSGSTGGPKTVGIEQRSVIRLVRGTNFMDTSPSQVWLQNSPLTFDASTLEIWGALLNGGTLVVMPPGIASLDDLGRAIRENGVTTLWLTSALFNLVVDEQVGDLRGVRQLLTGGDVVSPEHLRKALNTLPGCVFINGYGPTENATFTCTHAVRRAEEVDGPLPIGRPIANTTIYVLDEKLRPVPPGTPGELFTGGDGLARGYLGNDALTAERFVPNPFSDIDPSPRLYRTGDRVRWRNDGVVEFLGRMDDQVKIRGYRIEPGEIEAVLGKCPRVRKALVMARASEEGGRDKVLVAYVEPVARDHDDEAAIADMRRFLAARLPDFMVPSSFVTLDAFPLTNSGKVDRSRLRALDEGCQGDQRNAAQPATELEKRIAGHWREVLKTEECGVNDNFFEMGGDSLLMVQVNKRLQFALQRPVTMAEMFEFPTIARLAAHLAACSADTPPPPEGRGRRSLAEQRTKRIKARQRN